MVGRKLTEQEAAVVEKLAKTGSNRLAKEALYDSLAADFEASEYGELTLDEGENKATVRKHFTAALDRKGLKVDWMRGKGTTLRFQVTA